MGGVQRAPIFRLVCIVGYFPFTAVPLARNCDIAHPIWRWIPLHTRIIYTYIRFFIRVCIVVRVYAILLYSGGGWENDCGVYMYIIHRLGVFFPPFFFFYTAVWRIDFIPGLFRAREILFLPPSPSVRSTRPRLRLLYRNTLSHRVLSLFLFFFFSPPLSPRRCLFCIYTRLRRFSFFSPLSFHSPFGKKYQRLLRREIKKKRGKNESYVIIINIIIRRVVVRLL